MESLHLWIILIIFIQKNKDVDLESASRNFGGYIFSYFDGLLSQISYNFVRTSFLPFVQYS